MKLSGIFRLLLFLVIVVSFNSTVYSQDDLYIPLNIKKAYDNGTRNKDGSPGPNYWQNSSDYKISVEIGFKEKILYGSETINYHNNSPDTLKMLVIRLYQNIFKKGSARDFPANEKAINDGVIISKMMVRGENTDSLEDVKIDRRGTNMYIELDDPVPPGKQIQLAFDWNFIIPHEMNLRMGTYDSTSFFIGYWYPQIAVYDDIDGWDKNQYGGQQEFYNDFSNYEVEVKVPNTFSVWATGIFQNPSEVLSPDILERYNSAHNSVDVVKIVTQEDIDAGSIYNNANEFNVWIFRAENVTDFAFALSDHYLWDGVSTVVDSTTNRKVYIQAVYKAQSKSFYDVAEIAKQAIEYLSFEMPAVPFPYPNLTVFNGSGGMEYPMMVNEGSAKFLAGTVGVTSHEITHAYFPFYMGINERKYAFMDEGWAVMLPYDFQERMAENNFPRKREAFLYERIAGTERDVPLIVPSMYLKGVAYRTSAYSRPANAYDFLRKMLGDKLFLNAMHEYMDRWHGKHPIPYDFYFTFNDVAGKSLNWYWKPWFFDFAYPDLSISEVVINGNNLNVKVQKNGTIPVPVKLTFIYADSSQAEIYRDVSVWASGNKNIIITEKTDKTIDKIILGDAQIPDLNSDGTIYIVEQKNGN